VSLFNCRLTSHSRSVWIHTNPVTFRISEELVNFLQTLWYSKQAKKEKRKKERKSGVSSELSRLQSIYSDELVILFFGSPVMVLIVKQLQHVITMYRKPDIWFLSNSLVCRVSWWCVLDQRNDDQFPDCGLIAYQCLMRQLAADRLKPNCWSRGESYTRDGTTYLVSFFFGKKLILFLNTNITKLKHWHLILLI
jgi:hypothetical protein